MKPSIGSPRWKLREQAGEWRRALERAVRDGRSLQILRTELRREGCSRTIETLRRWITDETIIGPRNGASDVEAILRVTEDSELASKLEECLVAMDTLWRLHVRCGHQLALEVMERARAYLKAGALPDELVEIEETSRVGRHRVDRPGGGPATAWSSEPIARGNMARMIPGTVHSSVRSGAERRIFKIIETSPGSDGWVCFHSLGLARHETKRRGEVDFVILTSAGVFVLEVKGGRVRREAGYWVFTDRFGVEHRRVEGPFDQAASAMFSLEREIRIRFAARRGWRPLFCYGVVLPDIEFDLVDTEGDQELVFDRRDRHAPFSSYLKRLARFAESRSPQETVGLTSDEIDELTEFLRGDFDLIPSMEVVVEDTRRQLAALTQEQGLVLEAAGEQPRLLVEGAAGSGKTILAVEVARREARRGRRVLFLCYNRMLCSHVQRLVGREDFRGSVEVQTVHQHLRGLILTSSLREEFEERAAQMSRRSIFEKSLSGIRCIGMPRGRRSSR